MLPSATTMVEQLMDLSPNQLTTWESDFLSNVEVLISSNEDLTEAQYTKLEEMFQNKIHNAI